VFPITVLFMHLIASQVLNLYIIFPDLDIPFHYIGGLSIAYTSAQILSYLEEEKICAALNKLVFRYCSKPIEESGIKTGNMK